MNLDQSGGGLSQGRRKHFKEHIVETAEELGLIVSNLEDTKSRRSYNRYVIKYPALYMAQGLNPNLIIETVYTISAFPVERREAKSIICDFLKEEGVVELIKKYELEPFLVTAQSLERTFVDKIFAICDYVLDGRIREHSRHIYDLHMLMPHIEMNEDLGMLYKEIKAIRRVHDQCPSARHEEGVAALLAEIIDDDLYKSDYNDITIPLLFEKVSYQDAMETIRSIYSFVEKIEMDSSTALDDSDSCM